MVAVVVVVVVSGGGARGGSGGTAVVTSAAERYCRARRRRATHQDRDQWALRSLLLGRGNDGRPGFRRRGDAAGEATADASARTPSNARIDCAEKSAGSRRSPGSRARASRNFPRATALLLQLEVRDAEVHVSPRPMAFRRRIGLHFPGRRVQLQHRGLEVAVTHQGQASGQCRMRRRRRGGQGAAGQHQERGGTRGKVAEHRCFHSSLGLPSDSLLGQVDDQGLGAAVTYGHPTLQRLVLGMLDADGVGPGDSASSRRDTSPRESPSMLTRDSGTTSRRRMPVTATGRGNGDGGRADAGRGGAVAAASAVSTAGVAAGESGGAETGEVTIAVSSTSAAVGAANGVAAGETIEAGGGTWRGAGRKARQKRPRGPRPCDRARRQPPSPEAAAAGLPDRRRVSDFGGRMTWRRMQAQAAPPGGAGEPARRAGGAHRRGEVRDRPG